MKMTIEDSLFSRIVVKEILYTPNNDYSINFQQCINWPISPFRTLIICNILHPFLTT